MSGGSMDLKIDAILERRAEIGRAHQMVDLNATCLYCQSDILDTLLAEANDWGGYGPPSSVSFPCPHCGLELTYDLEWCTDLYRASREE